MPVPLRLLALLSGLLISSASFIPVGAAINRPPVFSNVQVSKDTYLAHSEPALAMNPRNHLNLLAGSKMFTNPSKYEFKIGTYYSKDGGKTWHDSGFLPGFGDYELVSDVSIAFAPNGTAYVCVLAWDGGDNSGIYVLRSKDGGKTFSAPVPVYVDTTGAYFNDKPWIAVDRSKTFTRGTVYVAWNLDGPAAADRDPDGGADGHIVRAHAGTDYGDGGIAVSRSVDGGATFSAPTIVAPFDQEHFYIGAIPAVAPGGTLYVPFLSYDSSNEVDGMAMVRSTDGGTTFSSVRVVQNDIVGVPDHLSHSTFRVTSMPSFAISPKDGALVLVWADYRYNDADVMASTSKDYGHTWSKPVRVNHDKVRNGKDQFMPEVATSANGVITCAWFDRSYDSKGVLIDEAVAQSASDGLAWGPSLRVTTHSWNPSIDAPQPEDTAKNTFIGDYQALAVDDHTIHPLWNDTQNGKSQQIRTATLRFQVFTRR